MGRRSELDWVRAISITAVLMIHASANFAARPSSLALLGVTPAFFCNQAARFGVPLFFLLSGLSLGLSPRRVTLPDFWLRRLRRVGLPYLGWTLFYFLIARWSGQGADSVPGGLRLLGRDLLLGGAASHLWFIPPLMELYLLYPLLRYLWERAPGLTLGAGFLITLVCTLIVDIPLPLGGWLQSHLWRLFPTWLFYFLLGMALSGERLEKLKAFCERHALLLPLLGLAGAFLYSLDSLRSGRPDSVKLQLFLYTPLVLVSLLAAWKRLRRPSLEKAAAFAARHGMTVYFVHVFLLELLRRISLFQRGTPGMLGLFAADALLSFAFAAALDALPRLLPARKK